MTDAEGRFATGPVDPGATVWVKAPGYERKKLTGGEATDVTIKLAPHPVRAAYLTYYGVADRTHPPARARASWSGPSSTRSSSTSRAIAA